MVSVFVVTITMLISVPAAFALSRMKFWGSATLATGVFLTYLIPETLLFMPLFKMFAVFNEWTDIELINRWWVLLILYPTLTVPFCTWIMIGYFASIPKELDEAALMDGANYRQILTRVFIPVALPGLIAATIFAFTVSWAQFLYPLAFTTSADQLVLPVGIITSLIKGDVFNWGQIMTGALLGAAPPLIIYAFLMDYYIAGPHRRRDEGLSAPWRRSRFARWSSTSTISRRCSGIDLDIADKEFVVLVGPSGCGKSTTLRMIAGLEEITGGEIAVDGEVVNDVPPKDRDIAMVFQNYALYPHMTVYENMSFGLRLQALSEGRDREAGRRRPPAFSTSRSCSTASRSQLSGGQRQRVAMGRAIVRDPKVFLFDEPLSNLDAKLRVQMRTEIKRVHQKVAHHDDLRHPRSGRGDDAGRPRGGDERAAGSSRSARRNDLYQRPANRFVAGFIGSPAMNFLPCDSSRTVWG